MEILLLIGVIVGVVLIVEACSAAAGRGARFSPVSGLHLAAGILLLVIGLLELGVV